MTVIETRMTADLIDRQCGSISTRLVLDSAGTIVHDSSESFARATVGSVKDIGVGTNYTNETGVQTVSL